MNEKNFFWMLKLYNSKYIKKRFMEEESGLLSDFEREIGFSYPNKAFREFLKQLIDESVLEHRNWKIVNNVSHATYVIDKKKLFNKIKDVEKYYKDMEKVFFGEFNVLDDPYY